MREIHFLLGALLLPAVVLAQNNLTSTPLEQQQRVLNQQSELHQQQRTLMNQQQEQRRLQQQHQYSQDQRRLLQPKPVVPITPSADPFKRTTPAVPSIQPVKPAK